MRRCSAVSLVSTYHRASVHRLRVITSVLLLGVAVITFPQSSVAQTPTCVPSPYGCPGDRGPAVAPSPSPGPVYRPPTVQGPAQRATAINNEAVALENRGDYAGALAKFRQALKLDPSNTTLRSNLATAESRRINNEGAALWARGDIAGALAKVRQAHRLNPSNTSVRAFLARIEGTILYNRGDHAGAAAKLREAVALLREALAHLPSNSKDRNVHTKALEGYRADLALAEAELAKQRNRVSQQEGKRREPLGERYVRALRVLIRGRFQKKFEKGTPAAVTSVRG
jgi:tetratricopeptide (TPR) repeat protein